MLRTCLTVLVVLCCAVHVEAAEDVEANPSVGIWLADAAEAHEIVREAGVRLPRNGAYVVRVAHHYPAWEAGIRPGDIIASMEGRAVRSADELVDRLHHHFSQDHDEARLLVRRMQEHNGRTRWARDIAQVNLATEDEVLADLIVEEHDEISGLTTYRHRHAPTTNRRTQLTLRVVESDGRRQPVLRVQYYGRQWLFMERMALKVNADVYETSLGNVKRDSTTRVWEWADLHLDESWEDVLQALEQPGDFTIRLMGRTYRRDRDLSDAERWRMWAVHRYFVTTDGTLAPVLVGSSLDKVD